MKKTVYSVLALCLALLLTACGKSADVIAAEKAISEIGNVTLETSDLIASAQELCEKLSEKDLKKVSNIKELENAQIKLKELYEELYQETYDEIVLTMLDSLVIAEELCNDTLAVWHNSIWKTDSEETNAYTKDASGVFYEDFNDALTAFFETDECQEKVAEIQENDDYISQMLEIIKNPTDEFKGSMLDAVVDYYSKYQSFINFTLNCNGTYNSFSEKFIELDESSIEAYQKAAFYMSTT